MVWKVKALYTQKIFIVLSFPIPLAWMVRNILSFTEFKNSENSLDYSI